MRFKKRIISVFIVFALSVLLLGINTVNVKAWRSSNARSVNGYSLIARADLPYSADKNRGGSWKAQSIYYGPKNSNRLTLSWSFYSIGGSVSFQGVGLSGSGTNSGSSFTYTANVLNASGNVYAHGFCLYVGMYSTATFSKGNSVYSVTTKI